MIVGTGVVLSIAGGSYALAAAATSEDGARDRAVSVAAPSAPKVLAEQALKIAEKEVPGGWVAHLSLDRDDDGKDVWDVDVVKGDTRSDLDIDATTGKVMSSKVDDDHRDDNDGRDDRDDDHDDDGN
ncbi:PepSY domain-containing protein [Nonomuraea sp. SMC257]|uniref:PepSY domain-containing protein n=1 Tax=Nonomuraea montanisoli TaxID=2741721 RepID=A0A7Y6IG66_9ACTN|nr:PepSY domain-containing protein [Nonomuraea montanisoli]NUW37506.1 PepSY domain-containing protein [Nonomuraea montanisoli]